MTLLEGVCSKERPQRGLKGVTSDLFLYRFLRCLRKAVLTVCFICKMQSLLLHAALVVSEYSSTSVQVMNAGKEVRKVERRGLYPTLPYPTLP